MKVLKAKVTKCYPYLIIALIAIAILAVQIYNHVTIVGYDSFFHMSRAYETAMQIKTGHFSYFMSLFSWLGSGRIVNAVYGPLGGYFIGIVLLLTHSWFNWELVMDFIVLMGCGSTMFILGRFWKDNTIVNIIISGIYMVSYPAMTFVSNTEFTGVGAIFIPLVVLIGSKILITKQIPIIRLIVLITAIAEIHLMTLLISLLFLLPFVITGFIKSHMKIKYCRMLAKAIIWVLLLTVNVWGAIFEVLLSNPNHIIPTFPAQPNMGANWYRAIRLTHGSFSLIGGALALICIVCIVAWILTFTLGNTTVNTLMLTGTFFLWASSQWFPWETLQKAMPIINIIQFPKRFIVLGLVPMLVALGALVSPLFDLPHPALKTLILVFLCLLGFESWNYNNLIYHPLIPQFFSKSVITWSTTKQVDFKNSRQLRESLSSNNPGKFMKIVSKPIPDYLPSNIHYTTKRYNKLVPYIHDYLQLVKPFRNSKRYVKSYSNHATEHVKITVNYSGLHRIPFTVYKHTDVILNGKHPTVHPSQVGAMWIYLHAGENSLSIQYHPSYWFELGMFISILSWIMFILGVKWKRESEELKAMKKYRKMYSKKS